MHPHAESQPITRRTTAAWARVRLDAVHPSARRIVVAIAMLGLIGLVGESSQARAAIESQRTASASDMRDADSVKSAFVYNFAARHVKWPESAFKDKSSPFVIGVLGDDAIAKVLTATCKDRKSGERGIEVRVLDDVARAIECHILFVPSKRDAEVAELAKTLAKAPVLIVASSDVGVEQGAHIGFYLEKSKVRFAAHPSSAKKAGLEISSELLKLARVVERQDVSSP